MFSNFFFFCAWIVTSHEFTVHEKKRCLCTIHTMFIYCLYTVHEFHDTIHIFKNYFATIFSIFSFSKNKLYPNGLIIIFKTLLSWHRIPSPKKKKKTFLPKKNYFLLISFFFFFFPHFSSHYTNQSVVGNLIWAINALSLSLSPNFINPSRFKFSLIPMFKKKKGNPMLIWVQTLKNENKKVG